MKGPARTTRSQQEMLAPHKVDTSGYEKLVKEEQTAGMPEQKQEGQPKETQKQENMEQNQENPQQAQGRRGYQPIDETKINWQELEEKWGVKRDDLEKPGDLQKMLNYGKSDLVKVSPKFGGEASSWTPASPSRKTVKAILASYRTSSARNRNSTSTRNTSFRTKTVRTARNGQPRQGRGHRGQGNG